MMVSTTKIALGIVSFVTMIIFIIALMQMEFIRRLEDSSSSYGNGRLDSNGSSSSSTNKFFIQPLYDDISAYDKETISLRLGFIRPQVISWSPRVILFHNFLSFEECDYLIALAKPRIRSSNVIDRATGRGIPSEVRTSSGMFLYPKERKYPIIEAIENRISIYSQVPLDHGESIQVLRYEKGQHYRPHNDYFHDKFNIERGGGQRVATVLMYLSDVIEGGETYFPIAGSDNCSCGGEIVGGVSIKPIKGNAVLFWSMGLNGDMDPVSLHGGCDVVSGVKWSATKWMRQQPRNYNKKRGNIGDKVNGTVATI